jgi:glucokinase
MGQVGELDTSRVPEGEASEWVPERSIGIDVGGTKIAAAAVAADGEIRHRREIATRPGRGIVSVLADIEAMATAIASDMHDEGAAICAVGLGVPEVVDLQGRVRSSHSLDWSQANPGEHLEAIAPLVIVSDVHAAAWAEARFGAGREYRSFAYVTVGTGISSAFVLDGVPHAGARGGAMVLTSGMLSVPCNACGDWSEFVLEEYASGPALARRFAAAAGMEANGAETVTAAANAGDRMAREIVDSATAALGSAMGWLVNVLDPEAVIIGGGLGLSGGRYWECLVQNTRTHIWNPEARDLSILRAALGPDSGVVGAAEAAQRRIRGVDHSAGPPDAARSGERR